MSQSVRKAPLTALLALLAPERSILLGLVADASALSGGGVGRGAAGAVAAVNEDIVASVSED